MTKKIYLQTFKKCAGSLCFTLLAFVATMYGLSYRLHMWEAGETPWKQRGLLMDFAFSRKIFGTLRGLASILKNLSFDEILYLHACSVHWEGTLLSQLLFPLIAVPEFVLKDKPFVNFLCPPFSVKSGTLYCPSEHAVTLFPVLSLRFPGLVLMQEVKSSIICILLSC